MTAPTDRAQRSLIDIDATFLPIGGMRQITRVTDLSTSSIDGEVELGPDHWAYGGHFPGDPIFPGTLMIEAAGQLVALWAWSQGERGRPRLVRTNADFKHPVGPGSDRLLLRAEVKRRRNMFFAEVSIWSDEVHVATVGATLAVLPGI